MRKELYADQAHTRNNGDVTKAASDDGSGGLPNRLLTAFQVAEFIGCHEETVRRAYSRGLLTSQRFGVRGRRFHPADVHDWIKRGAPTRVS
jgi:excisionase family DNA binding protein